MGFRIRKSIKVPPGVRFSVSKRGVGASTGAGGMHYSAHYPRPDGLGALWTRTEDGQTRSWFRGHDGHS